MIKSKKKIKPEVIIAAAVFAVLCIYEFSLGVRNLQFISRQKQQLQLADERLSWHVEPETAEVVSGNIQNELVTETSQTQPRQEFVRSQTRPEITEPLYQRPVAVRNNNRQSYEESWDNWDGNLTQEQLFQTRQAVEQMQSELQNFSQAEWEEFEVVGAEILEKLQDLSNL